METHPTTNMSTVPLLRFGPNKDAMLSGGTADPTFQVIIWTLFVLKCYDIVKCSVQKHLEVVTSENNRDLRRKGFHKQKCKPKKRISTSKTLTTCIDINMMTG